jgi:hypothetical protein
MPTVVREGGFEIKINLKDHFPPHVHVWKAGAEVRINLVTGDLMTSDSKMSSNDIRQGRRLVYRHVDFLRKEWVRFHGSLERIN